MITPTMFLNSRGLPTGWLRCKDRYVHFINGKIDNGMFPAIVHDDERYEYWLDGKNVLDNHEKYPSTLYRFELIMYAYLGALNIANYGYLQKALVFMDNNIHYVYANQKIREDFLTFLKIGSRKNKLVQAYYTKLFPKCA